MEETINEEETGFTGVRVYIELLNCEPDFPQLKMREIIVLSDIVCVSIDHPATQAGSLGAYRKGDDRIAQELHKDPRVVRESIKRLVEQGYICRERENGRSIYLTGDFYDFLNKRGFIDKEDRGKHPVLWIDKRLLALYPLNDTDRLFIADVMSIFRKGLPYFKSTETICGLLNKKRSAVKAMMKKLKDDGLIVIEYKSTLTGKKRCVYPSWKLRKLILDYQKMVDSTGKQKRSVPGSREECSRLSRGVNPALERSKPGSREEQNRPIDKREIKEEINSRGNIEYKGSPQREKKAPDTFEQLISSLPDTENKIDELTKPETYLPDRSTVEDFIVAGNMKNITADEAFASWKERNMTFAGNKWMMDLISLNANKRLPSSLPIH